MSTRRLAAFGLGGVAVVVIVVLLAGTGLGWWNGAPAGGPPPSTPIALETALTPNPAFFGDLVEARVTVYYDARTVAPGSIHLSTSFNPYVETQPPTVRALHSGDAAGVVYRYTIQCLTDDCLPLAKPKRLRFPPAVVTGLSGTQRLRVTAKWPLMYVTSRLSPAEVSSGQHFRRPSTVLPPSYSVAPGTLEAVLVAAAVLLGVGGLTLLVLELRRVASRRRARLAGIQGRALALAYARESAEREDAADRRKALGLLAETLAAEGEAELAASAGDVAWAEPPPSPDETLRLVDEVERSAPEEEAKV